MKIKKIKLQNYKFHHSLEFNIRDNSLIYGENGTGKSSIYKALYSNLYFFKDNKIVTNQIDVREKFINRDFFTEDLEVNIYFNNGVLFSRTNNSVENSDIVENQTIYFTDEKVLHKIVQNNFYEVIDNELVKHFSELNYLNKLHNRIEALMWRTTEQEELIRERKKVDNEYKELFNKLIPINEINIIINQKFHEDFEIEFDIKDSDIQVDNQKIIFPQISIKVKNVKDNNDLKNHFNEAKLKLISIAIYFALAKKHETDSELKLLVLDDFLTSLDMANRKLIIQYILEEFEDYQKIILTHNIQFYNLIVRLLKIRDEEIKWDIKNIFLYEENNQEVATISNRNEDYLSKAENELNNYHLEVSGNFLRKEFERIVNEFEQLLELGRVEELDNVIKALQNLDFIFPEPSKNLKSISTKFNNIIANNSTDDIAKYNQLKDEIEKMPTKLRFRNNELSFLKETLLKTELYKNILMNASSHDDREKELYRKEFKNSIQLLKKLNQILATLK